MSISRTLIIHNHQGCNLSKQEGIYITQNQSFQSGREVVFQCRDEGLLRARVRWIRGNGLPLPPGSRDINGRLEIPNIQLEHAGTYICEAVGYPPSTPGRQVNVILTVEKCMFLFPLSFSIYDRNISYL